MNREELFSKHGLIMDFCRGCDGGDPVMVSSLVYRNTHIVKCSNCIGSSGTGINMDEAVDAWNALQRSRPASEKFLKTVQHKINGIGGLTQMGRFLGLTQGQRDAMIARANADAALAEKQKREAEERRLAYQADIASKEAFVRSNRDAMPCGICGSKHSEDEILDGEYGDTAAVVVSCSNEKCPAHAQKFASWSDVADYERAVGIHAWNKLHAYIAKLEMLAAMAPKPSSDRNEQDNRRL